MSWPSARKVLAALSRTAVLGVADGLAGVLDAGTTAVLPGELQAVTSKAAQAIPAQPATCRARRAVVINMIPNPLTLNVQ